MPIHSFETLAKMKAEIRMLARVAANCTAQRDQALESVNMRRYDTESQQRLLAIMQLRAVGRLYRAFLSENDKELERMAKAYGQA